MSVPNVNSNYRADFTQPDYFPAIYPPPQGNSVGRFFGSLLSGVAGGIPGVGGIVQGLQMQRMMDSMQQTSQQSLMMQFAMNMEQRRFEMMTNILKVRHDSAMSAIRNIRG